MEFHWRTMIIYYFNGSSSLFNYWQLYMDGELLEYLIVPLLKRTIIFAFLLLSVMKLVKYLEMLILFDSFIILQNALQTIKKTYGRFFWAPLGVQTSNDYFHLNFFKYTLHMMLRRYWVILRIKPHSYLVPDHGCNNPHSQHMIK